MVGLNRGKREKTANSLFWNILPASRLFAIFCGRLAISGQVKGRRINNLAPRSKKKLWSIYAARNIALGVDFVPATVDLRVPIGD